MLFLVCEKLPLDIFIDCLIDNDLKQLIISGTATEKKLQEVWDNIYVQYCQLSQDGTYNQVFELMKEVNDLRAKITIVNSIVTYLQIRFDKELVDILNVFTLLCDITEDDKDDVLITKLNLVVARMKNWFPLLEQREKDLEEIRKTNTGKVDRAYFDDALDIMSEAKGYQIEAGKITVSRFCRSLVRMNEQAKKEQLKQKVHGI
ncbi:MAG: hypothetical protein NVSMB46_09630 [Candidatus Saccharimonadales bacterium]